MPGTRVRSASLCWRPDCDGALRCSQGETVRCSQPACPSSACENMFVIGTVSPCFLSLHAILARRAGALLKACFLYRPALLPGRLQICIPEVQDLHLQSIYKACIPLRRQLQPLRDASARIRPSRHRTSAAACGRCPRRTRSAGGRRDGPAAKARLQAGAGLHCLHSITRRFTTLT